MVMKKRWLILVAISGVVLLLANSIGVTRASFVDQETSSDNSLTAWSSECWTQTTQGDFEAGVPSNVDTTSSSGDVKLATSSSSVSDSFTDESKIASIVDVVVTGGQVKLSTTTATEILRPDGAGDVTNVNWVYPDTIQHWDAVNDTTPDDDNSYVSAAGGKWSYDLYSIADHTTGSGPINYVKVYMRCKALSTPTQTSAQVVIKTNGTEYRGSEQTVTTSYADYSEQWNTNPETGSAWTWTEIDALQAGVALRDATGGEHTLCTQVYVEVSCNTYYQSPGMLTSTNLLSSESASSIDSFSYDASSIPLDTGLQVQFSKDNSNWYNSTGTSDGWDTCSQGSHTIDLSSLGWSGDKFYYKMQFTSNTNRDQTPVLDEISISYTKYYSSGTIASQVLDTGNSGARWDGLFWDETLPSSTDITFKVRASDTEFLKDAATPDWTSVAGTSPVTSGLPSGRYKQWRATLTTLDSSKTPILQEVRVYYY
jgi:hypothetical protein